MTIYFMGGEVGSFTPQDGDLYEDAQYYNSSFARCGLRPFGDLTSAYSTALALPDDFWIHADLANQINTSTFKRSLILSTGGTDVLRVQISGSQIKIEALIGGVWAQVGSTITALFYENPQTIDLSVEGNSATGTITLYIEGVERTSGTADLSAIVGIDRLAIGPTSDRHYASQVIIADEPTIGWRLMTYVPTGAGATGDWTGDYTAIDERRFSDSDFINTTTANQIELFSTTPVGAGTGYIPRAVGVYCRARRGAGGPQNLQLALRSSGTTYFSGDKALSLGYGSYGHIWETNPATSAAFLFSALASLQPGVKSIT